MENREMSFEEFNGKCRKSKVYNAAMDSLREEMAELFGSIDKEIAGFEKEIDKAMKEVK